MDTNEQTNKKLAVTFCNRQDVECLAETPTNTNKETNMNEKNIQMEKPIRMTMMWVGRWIPMNRQTQVWVVESKNMNVKE